MRILKQVLLIGYILKSCYDYKYSQKRNEVPKPHLVSICPFWKDTMLLVPWDFQEEARYWFS